jgi:BirA family biotin operon repressor/biotin-[acetyl-CoA-carboxylase] ligase
LSGLSLAVGVGLAQGLEQLGAQGICLKWPNDLLLRNDAGFAKLAGILVELTTDRRGTQAIIGIGLNLQPPGGDLPQPAAGLSQSLTAAPDRHAVLAAILGELHAALEVFAAQGFAGVKADWQARHAWQGDLVEILGEDAPPLRGRCLGADDDGALLLETGGAIERIYAGDVSLRRS